METIRYLRALTRSWWLVLIALVAGGAGGYVVYEQATPMYSSSSRVIVGVGGVSDPVSNLNITEAITGQLASIAQSNPATAAAFSKAGSPPGGFSVSALASGQFVTFTVVSSNSVTAAAMANAYMSTIRQSVATLGGGSGRNYKLTTDFTAAPASAPFAPSRTKDVGIGLAAGLIVGLALALLREALNRTVRDSDGLRDLTGLIVYGTVPRDTKRTLVPARTDPRSPRSESYRQIRTSILNRTNKRPFAICVTSATLGEGKTSVATNVAAILSRAGHRVAIVDADLRRPRVHTFFEIQSGRGLSDVLLGTARLEDVLVELDSGNLAVVPAGRIPGDPAELLGSETMVDVLRQLTATYEFVLVDTPPVLPVTDALILGPLTDGVLFVAKLQGTTDDRIVKALQSLERVNAEVLGIVPNQARLGGDRADGYGYTYGNKSADAEGSPHPGRRAAPRPVGDPSSVSLAGGRPLPPRRTGPAHAAEPDPGELNPSAGNHVPRLADTGRNDRN